MLMVPDTLRVASFLSPLMYETYEQLTHTINTHLDYPARLQVGGSLAAFAHDRLDVGFLCGLLYARMRHWSHCPVELLVAPVLKGTRYRNQPIYFSDVIVRAHSPIISFEALHGCTWVYNEGASHSGYNLVAHHLLERGATPAFFGRMRKSGSHLASLEMVLQGFAEATALDSHVLDLYLQRHPAAATRIKKIAQLGPTAIPPVVVAKHLPDSVKQQLRDLFLSLHNDPVMARSLEAAGIQRFVVANEQDYEDIYAMYMRVQHSEFAAPI